MFPFSRWSEVKVMLCLYVHVLGKDASGFKARLVERAMKSRNTKIGVSGLTIGFQARVTRKRLLLSKM